MTETCRRRGSAGMRHEHRRSPRSSSPKVMTRARPRTAIERSLTMGLDVLHRRWWVTIAKPASTIFVYSQPKQPSGTSRFQARMGRHPFTATFFITGAHMKLGFIGAGFVARFQAVAIEQ